MLYFICFDHMKGVFKIGCSFMSDGIHNKCMCAWNNYTFICELLKNKKA